MDMFDHKGTSVIHLTRPLRCAQCCCFCCLQVRSMNGVVIGAITKTWSGLVKEFFTDADNFGVSFPKDLDVHLKDYMFFEKAYGQSDDLVPGMVG
ncbi:phospholipid scramblase 2-like [Haemaphysalis longicornis]